MSISSLRRTRDLDTVFYPENAGKSKRDVIEDMLIRASEGETGYPVAMNLGDEFNDRCVAETEKYAVKFTSDRMQKFMDDWYHWTCMMDELPDSAPEMQEKLLRELANELEASLT